MERKYVEARMHMEKTQEMCYKQIRAHASQDSHGHHGLHSIDACCCTYYCTCGHLFLPSTPPPQTRDCPAACCTCPPTAKSKKHVKLLPKSKLMGTQFDSRIRRLVLPATGGPLALVTCPVPTGSGILGIFSGHMHRIVRNRMHVFDRQQGESRHKPMTIKASGSFFCMS
jgi:hypothetical protein